MAILRQIGWILLWVLAIASSLFFIYTDVLPYLNGFRSKAFGTTLWNNQMAATLHMIAGTTALLCGPFQFWQGFRNRYLRLHRVMGKTYMVAALVISASAFRSSLISSCHPCRISLFITALLLLITVVAAWFAIKNRHIKQHRQFMVRSYVLMMAFVLVRVDGVLPLDFMFGKISDPLFRRVVNEYFFSFFPLIITEVAMVWMPYMKSLRK